MNKKILFFLLLLLIPVSMAIQEPEATSYWGNVAVDGNSTSDRKSVV